MKILIFPTLSIELKWIELTAQTERWKLGSERNPQGRQVREIDFHYHFTSEVLDFLIPLPSSSSSAAVAIRFAGFTRTKLLLYLYGAKTISLVSISNTGCRTDLVQRQSVGCRR